MNYKDIKGCLTDASLMNLPLFVWALHNRVSPSVDECVSCYKDKYGTTKNVQEFVTELPSAVKGWALLLEPFDLHKVDRFLQTVYGPRKAKSEE